MRYRIGSFNLYKFQTYRSDDEIKKNLDLIADIILMENFDIIALQEVYSESAMKLLIRRLGFNWEGRWGSPNSRSVNLSEGYAFIWNVKRITLAESITSSGRRIYEPRIYNQYRIDRSEMQRELVRNPYYGRFWPVNTFFEIRLINTHIMFSEQKRGEDENWVDLSDSKMRQNEYNILARHIYAKEADKTYGTNRPSYTILLGDYNLNLKREWTKGPYVDDYIEITDAHNIKHISVIQDQLTTLKGKSKNNPNESSRGYANNYDHFSYDDLRFKGVGVSANRIDTVRKYTDDDFDMHRKTVSDHIPIIFELNLKE